MKIFSWTALVIVSAVIALASGIALCAETQTMTAGSEEWVKTEIYLGTESIPGYDISKTEFTRFMDTVITKYFPKGFTLYETYGQMQEPNGTITKQETWVLVIVHEKTEERNKAITSVVEEYRKQFLNAEVMTTTSPVEVQFYTTK